MFKVVLPLLFAAFALTSALPVRNRFFEDVDDYKRDFLPKKTSDFYETAYDEYLRRREPALSEGLLEDDQDFPKAEMRVLDDYYYRDLPEKEEFSDDELFSRDFLPEEDERAFDKSDEDYPLEDPVPWIPREVYSDEADESFPEYSDDEEADEWLSRDPSLWANDYDDSLEEKEDDESDLADDADIAEEAWIAEEETNDAGEDEGDEDFEEAYTTEDEPADVAVEEAEDIMKESDAAAEEAFEEAKQAIVEHEPEGIPEDEAEEDDEDKQADGGEEVDEPQKEDEAAKANLEEDEVDETEEDDFAVEDTEEDEGKQADETEEEDEVDDMLQDEDETEEDDAAEEDTEDDAYEADQEGAPEEEDEADDMLEDDEIEDMTEEDAANELPIKEEDETEKGADELWKEDADAENDQIAEARASLARYKDFPSESKMVEDHKKLERELEFFKKFAFPSDDEAYEFDK